MKASKLSNMLAYPPRAMRLEQAAAYLSMSPSSFLRLVEEGELPPAVKKHAMALWDRLDLDAAFEDWKASCAEGPTAHKLLRAWNANGGPRENTVHKLLRERPYDRKRDK